MLILAEGSLQNRLYAIASGSACGFADSAEAEANMAVQKSVKNL
jgi:hypothetical protein